MSALAVVVGVGALFFLMFGLLTAATMRGRLGAASIALFVGACVMWMAALAAIVTGYRDADGFVDCRDECSSVQFFSALGFLAPPLLIALSALGMLVARGRRWRLRRRPIDENHR